MTALPLSAALARVLCELGRVERLSELGTNGPLLASAARTVCFTACSAATRCAWPLTCWRTSPRVSRATLVDLARLQGVRHNPRGEEEPAASCTSSARRTIRTPFACPRRLGLSVLRRRGHHAAVGQPAGRVLRALRATTCLDERFTDRDWRAITVRDSLLAALGWIVGRLDDPRRRRLSVGAPGRNRTASPTRSGKTHSTPTTTPMAACSTSRGRMRRWPSRAMPTMRCLIGADLVGGRPDRCTSTPNGCARGPAVARAGPRRVLAAGPRHICPGVTVEPDGRLRAARVVASSAGHLLASRLLDGADAVAYRKRLIARFGQPDLLGGAGVRTKSTSAPRFRAGSYHNGSVWPMDTGVIADGLRRHGARRAANDLDRRTLAGCTAAGGFPEFFRGDIDGSIQVNTQIVEAISGRGPQSPRAATPGRPGLDGHTRLAHPAPAQRGLRYATRTIRESRGRIPRTSDRCRCAPGWSNDPRRGARRQRLDQHGFARAVW